MNRFIFREYKFEPHNGRATFSYEFESGERFEEKVFFEVQPGYNAEALDKALFLAFVLTGTSYYKTFPSREVIFADATIDKRQSEFFDKVYQEGLSQFAFENNLQRSDLAHFDGEGYSDEAVKYDGRGVVSLQSGGKDSLLTATLLKRRNREFSAWYLTSGDSYPKILDKLTDGKVLVSRRLLDREALARATEKGAMNGHVPVTYIVQSYALVQAILLGKNTVLTSVAHEGEEAHDYIDDLPVNHQWSKTWEAEQLYIDYVRNYISPDIEVGSPLRAYSELRVAELFYDHAWAGYGHEFSSCNVANYTQGANNTELKWCGDCPKCANSYLLFAPFVEPEDLKSLFGGQDLFAKESLQETFKGLLGVDGVMKPFECVGEIDELRYAYHLALQRGEFEQLSFDVPEAAFDYRHLYDAQRRLTELVS